MRRKNQRGGRDRNAASLGRDAGWTGCENLEPRQLLAAISWDGDAGDNNWSTAANWSTNTVPTLADDVTVNVAGNPTITVSGGAAVNSLVTNEALRLLNGLFNVGTTATIGTGGSVSMEGGTVFQGTWSLAGGTFNTTSLGGTITNATLNFDLLLTQSSANVVVQGFTRFNSARLQGSNVNLRIAPGYALQDDVIAEGVATGTRTITYASGGTGAFVLSGADIRLATGTGGNLTITDSSVGEMTILAGSEIVNDAVGRTLTIGGTDVFSLGTIRANAGTTTISATTFDNTELVLSGTIAALPGATLNLGGTFDATGGIGNFLAAGASVNITGTILNTGNTITLTAPLGSWTLAGGTVSGGTLAVNAGGTFGFSASGGTLSGVTFPQPLNVSASSTSVTLLNTSIAGDLILSGSSTSAVVQAGVTFSNARLQNASTLRFAPGTSIGVPVIAEGAASGARTVTIAFGGTGTVSITAAGSIRLAAGTGGNLSVNDSSVGTLLNLGSIINEASGRTLTISPNTFVNQNLVQASAGTTAIAPTTLQTNLGASSISVGAAGTLNLGATTLWNAAAGIGTWANAGGTVNITGNVTNTGGVLTLNAATGSWTMLGGTINGGSVVYAAGRSILFSSNGGTLANVSLPSGFTLSNSSETITLNNTTVPGEILLAASSTSVVIQGTTTFTGIRLQNSNTTARFTPGYTLNAPVIAEGATGTSNRTVTIAFGGTGTFTIGPAGSIRLAAGSAGSLSVSDSSVGTLINNGSIINEAVGRTLTVSPTTFTNNAIVQTTAGTTTLAPTTFTNSAPGSITASDATLTISATNWSNAGSISVTNSTFNLGGTFTTSAFNFAGFSRVGGSVNLTGTLTNTGSTLTLNASTGSWTMFGGTINGGTVAYAGAASLLFSTSGGTLSNLSLPSGFTLSNSSDNITLNNTTVPGEILLTATTTNVVIQGTTTFTAVRLQNSSTTARFAPGYTLNAPLIAEGATGTSNRNVTIAFGSTGTFTIGPAGSIRLAAGTAGGLSINDSSAGTLINNGSIINEAAGRTLTLAVNTFTNNASVQTTAGTTTLSPTTFTNSAPGSITASNATLNISGTNWSNPGSISVTNSTLNLGGTFTTSGFNFAGFSRVGGSVNLTGTLTNTGGLLTLNAATGSWTMFGGTINGGSVALAGGASLLFSSSGGTLNTVVLSSGLTLPNSSDTITLNNTTVPGEILLTAASTSVVIQGTTTFTGIRLQNSSASARFAPGYTLNAPVIAEGATGTSNRNVTFAFGGTGTFTIGPAGSIRLAAGTAAGLSISDSSVGTLVNNGSIINEAAGRTLIISSTTFTNNATISSVGGVLNLSPTTFTNFSGGTLTGGIYSASAGGSFAGSFVGVITTLAASVVQDAVSAIWTSLAGLRTITSAGSLTLAGGTDLSLTPSGGTFVNQGTLSLGLGSTLSIAGAVTLAPTSVLRVFIAGVNVSDYGRIVATGNVTAGGTLDAQLAGGYQPVQGDAQDFITTDTTTQGSFATVSLFTTANPVLKPVLLDVFSGFQIVTSVIVDFNDDGQLDLGDFLIFFNLYDALDPAADIDGSGEVDLGDFLLFFNLYDQA